MKKKKQILSSWFAAFDDNMLAFNMANMHKANFF